MTTLEKQDLLFFCDVVVGATNDEWRKSSVREAKLYSDVVTVQDEALGLQLLTFYHFKADEMDDDYDMLQKEYKLDVAKRVHDSGSSRTDQDSDDNNSTARQQVKTRVAGTAKTIAVQYYNAKIFELEGLRYKPHPAYNQQDVWVDNPRFLVDQTTGCYEKSSRCTELDDELRLHFAMLRRNSATESDNRLAQFGKKNAVGVRNGVLQRGGAVEMFPGLARLR